LRGMKRGIGQDGGDKGDHANVFSSPASPSSWLKVSLETTEHTEHAEKEDALIRVHPCSSVANSSSVLAISDAANKLHEAREHWLNPPDASAAELKKRTLTNLYNDREAGRATWLNHLHRELDHAVLAAYGWEDLAGPLFQAEDALRAANPKGEALGLKLGRTATGQELMKRLLELNAERADP